ncbi:hypothetical protein RAB80_001458 [Fusarium oxysporum f. sp. vasinfectum]|uniref:Uncharacterized protein n=1 Tax=Fusarium oxysporum f. sp. vasinfectum 25433 TaxID=1089449 RepID=X0MA26_FUSOX|nr:hypothetical protein FOTG_04281 [Fusarium oxysporum f. sp. vasinfectum 25433]KAK2683512.1 hypothetical protein RAB80_001458 [Fusarium oxysporum f. sp. vasinfectum]KAK2937236.1 hypothetical protein FoTM2_000454 [Fusarium oxysporum f. sp. vasinfectum]
MPPKIIPVLEMKDFAGAIKKTDNKRWARDNVKLVLEHFNHMKPDMPQVALDRLATFLLTENWVTSEPKPSQYRLYKILKGQGRTQQKLHFGMWTVVSAIYPKSPVVVALARDMSKHWGLQFPGTAPWFPPDMSTSTIEDKWDGLVLEPVKTKNGKNSKKGKKDEKGKESKESEYEESEDEESEEFEYEKDKSKDEKDESLDTSDSDENERKRKADLLNEADKNSAPKKQKTSSLEPIPLSDDESEPDVETLQPKDLKALLLRTQREAEHLRVQLRAETKEKNKLAKQNGDLQDNVLKNHDAMKKMSSENKALDNDNLVKSETIQKFIDEFQKQEEVISNSKAKYRETKARLRDIELKYVNSMVAIKDANLGQEVAEADLQNTSSQLDELTARYEYAMTQLNSPMSKQEDTEAELKDTVSQLNNAKSKQEDTEAKLKDAVSRLEKLGSNEQTFRQQIMTLEHKLRGWEVAASQASHANPATVHMSAHHLATCVEGRFDRVDRAMADIAKKQQEGFDAMAKELSKKDN